MARQQHRLQQQQQHRSQKSKAVSLPPQPLAGDSPPTAQCVPAPSLSPPPTAERDGTTPNGTASPSDSRPSSASPPPLAAVSVSSPSALLERDPQPHATGPPASAALTSPSYSAWPLRMVVPPPPYQDSTPTPATSASCGQPPQPPPMVPRAPSPTATTPAACVATSSLAASVPTPPGVPAVAADAQDASLPTSPARAAAASASQKKKRRSARAARRAAAAAAAAAATSAGVVSAPGEAVAAGISTARADTRATLTQLPGSPGSDEKNSAAPTRSCASSLFPFAEAALPQECRAGSGALAPLTAVTTGEPNAHAPESTPTTPAPQAEPAVEPAAAAVGASSGAPGPASEMLDVRQLLSNPALLRQLVHEQHAHLARLQQLRRRQAVVQQRRFSQQAAQPPTAAPLPLPAAGDSSDPTGAASGPHLSAETAAAAAAVTATAAVVAAAAAAGGADIGGAVTESLLLALPDEVAAAAAASGAPPAAAASAAAAYSLAFEEAAPTLQLFLYFQQRLQQQQMQLQGMGGSPGATPLDTQVQAAKQLQVCQQQTQQQQQPQLQPQPQPRQPLELAQLRQHMRHAQQCPACLDRLLTQQRLQLDFLERCLRQLEASPATAPSTGPASASASATRSGTRPSNAVGAATAPSGTVAVVVAAAAAAAATAARRAPQRGRADTIETGGGEDAAAPLVRRLAELQRQHQIEEQDQEAEPQQQLQQQQQLATYALDDMTPAGGPEAAAWEDGDGLEPLGDEGDEGNVCGADGGGVGVGDGSGGGGGGEYPGDYAEDCVERGSCGLDGEPDPSAVGMPAPPPPLSRLEKRKLKKKEKKLRKKRQLQQQRLAEQQAQGQRGSLPHTPPRSAAGDRGGGGGEGTSVLSSRGPAAARGSGGELLTEPQCPCPDCVARRRAASATAASIPIQATTGSRGRAAMRLAARLAQAQQHAPLTATRLPRAPLQTGSSATHPRSSSSPPATAHSTMSGTLFAPPPPPPPAPTPVRPAHQTTTGMATEALPAACTTPAARMGRPVAPPGSDAAVSMAVPALATRAPAPPPSSAGRPCVPASGAVAAGGAHLLTGNPTAPRDATTAALPTAPPASDSAVTAVASADELPLLPEAEPQPLSPGGNEGAYDESEMGEDVGDEDDDEDDRTGAVAVRSSSAGAAAMLLACRDDPAAMMRFARAALRARRAGDLVDPVTGARWAVRLLDGDEMRWPSAPPMPPIPVTTAPETGADEAVLTVPESSPDESAVAAEHGRQQQTRRVHTGHAGPDNMAPHTANEEVADEALLAALGAAPADLDGDLDAADPLLAAAAPTDTSPGPTDAASTALAPAPSATQSAPAAAAPSPGVYGRMMMKVRAILGRAVGGTPTSGAAGGVMPPPPAPSLLADAHSSAPAATPAPATGVATVPSPCSAPAALSPPHSASPAASATSSTHGSIPLTAPLPRSGAGSSGALPTPTAAVPALPTALASAVLPPAVAAALQQQRRQQQRRQQARGAAGVMRAARRAVVYVVEPQAPFPGEAPAGATGLPCPDPPINRFCCMTVLV